MIVVRQPGLLTTVQDLGRPGWAHLGVPLAGAVDRAALRAANRMVGNPEGAAVLETTLDGPELVVEADVVLAVAGARCALTVGGQVVDREGTVTARRGRTVRLGTATRGVRSYLAVRGGIDVPEVLGSRSTCTLSGLGPAPLRAGDRLAIGTVTSGAVGLEELPPVLEEPVLRLALGPRDDAFTAEAVQALTSSAYVVSPASDRTGVRLQGASLRRRGEGELPSEGMVPGAVQVPPDGQPIVFLANCPTTGGYPVVGVVVPEDLAHAAQARPGTRLRFSLA